MDWKVAYEWWYFSRLQLSLMAGILTAVTSTVLLQTVVPGVIVIAVLGTYVVYSVDDIIDREQDQGEFPVLRQLQRFQSVKALVTVPIAVLILLYTATRGGLGFLLFIGSLGLLGLLFNLSTSTLQNLLPSRFWRLARPAFISLVWAVVCVCSPFVFLAREIGLWDALRVGMTVIYLWQLMFVYSITWKTMSTHTAKEAPEVEHDMLFGEKSTLFRLEILCYLTILEAAAAIVVGFFPVYNLIVIFPSLLTWVFLSFRRYSDLEGRLYFDLMVLANVICALAILLVYWLAVR